MPSGEASHEGRWRLNLLYGAMLAAATAWAYRHSFAVPFLFDDYAWIHLNPSIRQFAWHHLLSANASWGARPLVSATLALNYALGGYNPVGYHVFNFLVHIAAAFALFAVVAKTLQLPSLHQRYGKAAPHLAFCVALLWALHPLQTQAVTYIIQRCESMMGLFYLLCLYALLRGSQSAKPWPWYAAGIAACALGMGCKPVIATAPAVLLLYDRAFLATSWKMIGRRWWFYAGLLACAASTYIATARTALQTPRNAGAGFAIEGLTWWQYLRTQPQVLLHYLRLSVWPDVLCFDYAWPVEDDPWAIFVPGSVIVGLVLLSAYAYWQWPKVGFLGLAFFFVLAPSSSFVPIKDLAVEHRMYLPLAPLVVLAVIGGRTGLRRASANPRVARVVGIGIISVAAVGFAVRSDARNQVYADPIRLWRQVIELAPHNKRAQENYQRWVDGVGRP